jgi:hypothetical protein
MSPTVKPRQKNRRERRAEKAVARRKRKPFVELDFSKPLPPFLDGDQFAGLVHTTKRSVERWRREGTGPAFLKVGGKILYATDTVLSWIKSGERTSTSEPPKAA